jgi:hypothetical protein
MKNARSELVRISASGEVHPIGTTASQRLRSRPGTYRVLPSPRHVVFLRYTGEDGHRDQDDGAIVRLAGEVTRPGGLCDIIGFIAQAGWRGELVVMENSSVRRLFFERGNIVGVLTNADDERLGQVMYRFGALTQAQLAQLEGALAEQARPVGEVAVELGFVAHSDVFGFLRKQVEEVVLGVLTVDDGTYFFLEGFDESLLVSHQIVNANAVLMDGVRRFDEIKYFRDKIPSSEHIPCVVKGASIPVPSELEETFRCIDDNTSIIELGRQSGAGEFAVTKDVFALIRLGCVQISPPRSGSSRQATVVLGNEALRCIHREADEAGVGGEFREALASFASGAGLYDILFRGAGPARDGTLDPDTVANNSQLVDSANPDVTLRRMLHEYVAFAVFSLQPKLNAAASKRCEKQVSEVLQNLQPSG